MPDKKRVLCSQCLFVASFIRLMLEKTMVNAEHKEKKLAAKSPLVGIIGAGGQLGSAITQTFLDYKWEPFRLAITGRRREKLLKFERLGVKVYENVASLVQAVKLVIISVGVQHVRHLGVAFREITTGSRLILSTISGISEESLMTVLGSKHLLVTRVDVSQLKLYETLNLVSGMRRTSAVNGFVESQGDAAVVTWHEVHARAARQLIPDARASARILDTIQAFCLEEGLDHKQAHEAAKCWLVPPARLPPESPPLPAPHLPPGLPGWPSSYEPSDGKKATTSTTKTSDVQIDIDHQRPQQQQRQQQERQGPTTIQTSPRKQSWEGGPKEMIDASRNQGCWHPSGSADVVVVVPSVCADTTLYHQVSESSGGKQASKSRSCNATYAANHAPTSSTTISTVVTRKYKSCLSEEEIPGKDSMTSFLSTSHQIHERRSARKKLSKQSGQPNGEREWLTTLVCSPSDLVDAADVYEKVVLQAYQEAFWETEVCEPMLSLLRVAPFPVDS
ncbi:unnamed protein product [Ascophyllum nodosum]